MFEAHDAEEDYRLVHRPGGLQVFENDARSSSEDVNDYFVIFVGKVFGVTDEVYAFLFAVRSLLILILCC